MRTGVNSFQASRLTQARESLGLTKVALASSLEVSQATITNWEAGKQFPEEVKLRNLSLILKMPVHWFLREQPYSGDGAYFFRSMASASKTARLMTSTRLDWMAEMSGTFQQWINWPEVSVPCSEHHFQNLSDEEIELLAEQTRSAARVGSGPVSDVVLAMENCGIICARDEIGFTKMDGVSHWSPLDNRPYVFLSNDKSNGIRSRFDAAHELAHVVLHRHVTPEEQKQHHKEIERQADLFASCFLLPAASFAKEVVSRPAVETLLAIKPRWKVSIAAMIMRCYQLHLIDDRQKTNLFKRLSAKSWRIQEPYDDHVQFELPRLLPRAAHMLVDQGVLSKADLLEELAFSATICESLCSLAPGFFRDAPPDIDNLVELKASGSHSIRSNSKPGQVVNFQKR